MCRGPMTGALTTSMILSREIPMELNSIRIELYFLRTGVGVDWHKLRIYLGDNPVPRVVIRSRERRKPALRDESIIKVPNCSSARAFFHLCLQEKVNPPACLQGEHGTEVATLARAMVDSKTWIKWAFGYFPGTSTPIVWDVLDVDKARPKAFERTTVRFSETVRPALTITTYDNDEEVSTLSRLNDLIEAVAPIPQASHCRPVRYANENNSRAVVEYVLCGRRPPLEALVETPATVGELRRLPEQDLRCTAASLEQNALVSFHRDDFFRSICESNRAALTYFACDNPERGVKCWLDTLGILRLWPIFQRIIPPTHLGDARADEVLAWHARRTLRRLASAFYHYESLTARLAGVIIGHGGNFCAEFRQFDYADHLTTQAQRIIERDEEIPTQLSASEFGRLSNQFLRRYFHLRGRTDIDRSVHELADISFELRRIGQYEVASNTLESTLSLLVRSKRFPEAEEFWNAEGDKLKKGSRFVQAQSDCLVGVTFGAVGRAGDARHHLHEGVRKLTGLRGCPSYMIMDRIVDVAPDRVRSQDAFGKLQSLLTSRGQAPFGKKDIELFLAAFRERGFL